MQQGFSAALAGDLLLEASGSYLREESEGFDQVGLAGTVGADENVDGS